MRAAVITLIALTTLGACSAANDAADTIARDRAKSVVNSVVADKMPGLNAAPVTDCIIDAASAGEIVSIAGASVTGVTSSTVQDVLTIAQRPEAVQCIAQNSMTLLNG
ncbi:succinate dehydrogenase [Rhodobacteraceae bacterium KMM 6894]|nr:succinate dehydrogenase [Rhodobacteraceae bacterium KMM 6894]